MSFIRAKEIPPRSGNWYDYEVESYRDKGRVKQRVIRYIGRSGRSGGGIARSTAIRDIPRLEPKGE